MVITMPFDVVNACGIFIFSTGILGFVLNSFMIVLFTSNGLVSSKHSNATIYRLMLSFLVSNTAQLVPTIYIGLCATLQVQYHFNKVIMR